MDVSEITGKNGVSDANVPSQIQLDPLTMLNRISTTTEAHWTPVDGFLMLVRPV